MADGSHLRLCRLMCGKVRPFRQSVLEEMRGLCPASGGVPNLIEADPVSQSLTGHRAAKPRRPNKHE